MDQKHPKIILNPFCKIDILLDLEFIKPKINYLFQNKDNKKTLVIINNYNVYETDKKQT